MSDVDTPAPTAPLGRRPSASLLTSFVGRETDLQDVLALVQNPAIRLITVTGPGGVGKTRLTTELMNRIDPATMPGGIVMVELAAITDPAAVPGEILRALEDGRAPIVPELEAITLAFANQPALLMLDNLEQVVSVAPVLQEILMRCPELTIVVTSRLILRVRGEHEYVLEPLEMTATADGDPPAAVQLLIDRAGTARGNRSGGLDPEIAQRICQRVDGLPLAIELAAAQMRVLGPEHVLDRLERGAVLPSTGPRDMPARQQTMERAVAWSVDLLQQPERDLFSRLAVFASGFDIEAGLALSGLADENAFLTGLEELLAHSLVRRVDLELVGPRFTMLETIHSYGRRMIVEKGMFDTYRQTHADFFRRRARVLGPALRTSSEEQYRIWKLIETDIENYRSAVEYFTSTGHVLEIADLVGALDWFWTDGHFLSEGYRLLGAVIDDPAVSADPEVEIRALAVTAMLADHFDDLDRMLPLIDRAVALMRETNNTGIAAELLLLASGGLINQQQLNAARAKSQETIEEATRSNNKWFVAAAEMNMSLIDTLEGDYNKARAAAERAADVFEQVGDTDNVVSALNAIAYTWLFEGEYAKAQAAYQEVLLQQADRLEDAYFFQHVCWGTASVSAKTGRYELSARIVGMAYAESKRSQIMLRTPLQIAYEAMIADARKLLGEDQFDRLVAEGRSLSKAEAIAEIVGLAEPVLPTDRAKRPAPFNALSNREFEVLLHLMAGRTDPEIAAELFLSPRTVSQHVSAILNKLGVNSRTAAATMAAAARIR